MGILDLHAPEMESAAINSRGYVPRPQAPAFSVWGMAGAIPRGAVAGIGEMGASAVDVVSGLADAVRRLRDATPEQMREYERTGTIKPGDFQSDFGRAMRDEAQSWMPDAATSHAATTAVAEFSRMLGKVAATAPLIGPLGAAGVVGAEEGFTTADKLAQEGVDSETRSHVGAVTAAITAATFALPIAGQTVKATAALALGGGPVAYVAQQAATREILQRADYSRLAGRYDPFDPVGLALSTLLPIGFGAMGLRAASKARARHAAEDAARAERDFIAGDTPGEKSAIARAVEMQIEDAARVSVLREVGDAYRLTPADDLAGAAAHEAALARAMQQIVAREPVDVADLILPQTMERMDLDTEIAGLEAARVDLVADAANLADRGEVRQWRAELDALNARAPDVGKEAAHELAKQIQSSERLSFKASLAKAKKRLAEVAEEFTAKTDRIEAALRRNAKAQQAVQALAKLDERLSVARERQAALPELPRQQAAPDAPQAKQSTFAEFVARVDKAARDAGTEARRQAPAKQAAAPTVSTAPPAHEVQGIARAVADLEAAKPDLRVMLEGMDEAQPIGDVLRRVRDEAQAEMQDAKLIEVAAACALRAA